MDVSTAGTLLKNVECLEPGQVIKIGAKGGSSFFYTGTREDFIENADNYSMSILDKVYELIEDRKWKLETGQVSVSNQVWLQMIERLHDYAVTKFPLQERKVYEVFPADNVIDSSVVLIVEGIEMGKMWIANEKEPRISATMFNENNFGRLNNKRDK